MPTAAVTSVPREQLLEFAKAGTDPDPADALKSSTHRDVGSALN
jgi:hypothetical protein